MVAETTDNQDNRKKGQKKTSKDITTKKNLTLFYFQRQIDQDIHNMKSAFFCLLLLLSGDVETNPGPRGRPEPKPDKAKIMADKVESHDTKIQELEALVQSQKELIEEMKTKQVDLEKKLEEKEVQMQEVKVEVQENKVQAQDSLKQITENQVDNLGKSCSHLAERLDRMEVLSKTEIIM